MKLEALQSMKQSDTMKTIDSCSVGQIKGFHETSFLDWFGKISSVFFLSGCNLRCPYCHNHGLVLKPHSFPTIPQQIIESRLQEFVGWIDGIVISGGEPCLYSQLPDLIKFFRKLSFPVKLDTNGTKPDMLASLLDDGLIDYVAMDVKAPLDDIRYSRCVGIPVSVSHIKRSLAILAQSEIGYELRMTVCPTLIKEKDIKDLAIQLEGVQKFVLQAFNPKNTLDPDLRSVSPYDNDQMMEFKKILEEYVGECRVMA